jgi:hypothetical protein
VTEGREVRIVAGTRVAVVCFQSAFLTAGEGNIPIITEEQFFELAGIRERARKN